MIANRPSTRRIGLDSTGASQASRRPHERARQKKKLKELPKWDRAAQALEGGAPGDLDWDHRTGIVGGNRTATDRFISVQTIFAKSAEWPIVEAETARREPCRRRRH